MAVTKPQIEGSRQVPGKLLDTEEQQRFKGQSWGAKGLTCRGSLILNSSKVDHDSEDPYLCHVFPSLSHHGPGDLWHTAGLLCSCGGSSLQVGDLLGRVGQVWEQLVFRMLFQPLGSRPLA